MDLLEKYKKELNFSKISELIEIEEIERKRPHWSEYHSLMHQLELTARAESWFVIQENCNIIDVCSGLEIRSEQIANQLIKVLTPWRKGPFKVYQQVIDSEWQSWMKWQRLEKTLPSLKNKRIADVGSGNGYFMFQMAKQDPELILAFERSTLAYHQFQFLQSFAQDSRLQMNLIDSDALPYFSNFFDIVVCLGVIYHSRNPLLLLEQLKTSLKPGGFVFIESQIWPGEDSFCFFNADRYTKVKNVFFIPTVTTFKAWLARSGYKNIEIVSIDKTSFEEQRKTAFATFESLQDFLDPNNIDLTVEGHPAPMRALIKAEKA